MDTPHARGYPFCITAPLNLLESEPVSCNTPLTDCAQLAPYSDDSLALQCRFPASILQENL